MPQFKVFFIANALLKKQRGKLRTNEREANKEKKNKKLNYTTPTLVFRGHVYRRNSLMSLDYTSEVGKRDKKSKMSVRSLFNMRF